jgi:hypothetical protein
MCNERKRGQEEALGFVGPAPEERLSKEPFVAVEEQVRDGWVKLICRSGER